jgi:hypothetical protein
MREVTEVVAMTAVKHDLLPEQPPWTCGRESERWAVAATTHAVEPKA